MQAQTTRTFSGNLQKLAGGLLITAALAAGAIGLTSTGTLDFTRSEGNATSIAAPVYDTYIGPKHGEGLPLSREIPEVAAEPAGSVSHNRQLVAPQGEGFPMMFEEPSGQTFAPLGEGLPKGSGQ